MISTSSIIIKVVLKMESKVGRVMKTIRMDSDIVDSSIMELRMEWVSSYSKTIIIRQNR